MGLLKLPIELLVQIARRIDNPNSLATTHSRFRSVVEYAIYSDITLSIRTPASIHLLNTLLDRPDLRERVHALNFRCGRGPPLEDPEGPSLQALELELVDEPPQLSEEKIVVQLQTLGFTQKHFIASWVDDIQHANSDAIAALIVALTPNLKHLSLSSCWGVSCHYLGHVFRKALCERHGESSSSSSSSSLPAYEQLTSVTITPWFHYELEFTAPKEDNILALFYLPHIQHLSIPIANRLEMSWPTAHPPRAEKLESLQVSRLREQRLAPILSACPGLKTLHYSWKLHYGLDQPLQEAPLDLDEMASAIAQHCGRTLEILRIDASTELSPGYTDDPSFDMSGSLQALKALQHLRKISLPWAFVYGDMENPELRGIQNIAPGSLLYLQGRRQLGRYEEYACGLSDILQLIKGELRSGLLESAAHLQGIRTWAARTAKGLRLYEDDEEAIEQLRSDQVQVKLDEADYTVYLVLPGSRSDEQQRL